MGDRMTGLAKLGAEVSTSLENARTARDAGSRVREKLVSREMPRLRARRRESRTKIFGLRAVAGLAVAATLVVGVSFFVSSKHGSSERESWGCRPNDPAAAASPLCSKSAEKLSFVVGDNTGEKPGATGAFLAAPPAAEMPLTFSDGSKVRLAPSARVRVTEVARSGARVLVESGDVHVSVVHRDDTKWWVEAGPFEVRVTGTKFDVHWDPASTGLVVRLEEGSVYVRGCNLLGEEGRLLHAGEQLDVSCKDRVQQVKPIASAASPSTVTTEASEPNNTVTPSALPDAPPATSAPAVPASASASALEKQPDTTSGRGSQNAIDLARRGSHVEAIMAAEANGFAPTCDSLSGPELVVLADSARYAGRFERATEALEAARRRFPGSDAAGTAAFELGRIAMDVRRDLAAGGDHFETYLRERPNGSLAREALGRALEARHRSGDNVRAERLAVRYLATYPDGPFAKLARKINAGNQP
jgi:transmembrane sensor